jgi:hypothetical protein
MVQKGSVVGGWQSDKDMDEREKLIVKIANVLKQWKEGGASQEWFQKLPRLATKLEGSLYWSARFPSQYKDMSTLLQLLLRLKDLVVSIKRHQKAQKASKQRALQSTSPATQVLQSPTRVHLLLYQEQFRGLQEQQMATMQNQQQL